MNIRQQRGNMKQKTKQRINLDIDINLFLKIEEYAKNDQRARNSAIRKILVEGLNTLTNN